MIKKAFCVGLLLVLIGCQNHSNVYNQLVEIDSLLVDEQADSALSLVKDMDTSIMKEEELAYYNLLKAQCLYKSYQPISSDSIINLPINYYTDHMDKKKLAQSYFYRAGIRYDLGNGKEALNDLKRAEELIKMSKEDDLLCHNIYFLIAHINSFYHEYLLALKYSQIALNYSKRTHKSKHLLYDYDQLSTCYYNLGNTDSSLFYMNKSISMIDKLPKEPKQNRAAIWGNLGISYYNIDKAKSKQLMEKSLSIFPTANVYAALARIYLQDRDTTEARKLFLKGIDASKDLDTKAIIFQQLSEIEQGVGNYKQANEWMRREQALKDSLTRLHREDNIRAQQIAFDDAAKQEHSNDLLTYALIAIGCIALGSAGVVWYLRRRAAKVRLKAAEELKLASHKLETTQEQLMTANQDLRLTARELKSASKKLDKLKEEQKEEHKEQLTLAKTLESGHKLYTELLSGGNTAHWERKDFTDFIEYFRQVNSEYTQQIDADYQHLTPNENIFLALTHLGKTEEEVRDAMNLSDGAFNTMKSRLNAKKL